MAAWIALLRGINVGGNHKIKMIDLKELFENIGLCQVETYIQSGNILFVSQEDENAIRKKIEDGIVNTFGFSVPVILRSVESFHNIIVGCPFTPNEIQAAETVNSDGESFYVALLSVTPSEEGIKFLNSLKSDTDDCRLTDNNLYLLLRHSIRNSKLANSLQRIDPSVTVRNWKTISKLLELAKSKVD